jgi:DNA-binding NarL/FixJ family response regulator
MTEQASNLSLILVEDEIVYSKMIMYQLSLVHLDDNRELLINHVRSISELEEIKEFIEPEIVLLDLGLPDSSGEDSFHKAQSLFPNAAIIILTGNENSELGAHLIKCGAQDFIIKTEVNQEYLNRAITYTYNRSNNSKKVQSENSLYKLAFDIIPVPALIYNASTSTVIDINHSLIKTENSPQSKEWKTALQSFLSTQSKDFFSISDVIEIQYYVSESKKCLRISQLEGDNYLVQVELANEKGKGST